MSLNDMAQGMPIMNSITPVNKQDRLRGSIDVALNAEGIAQANDVGLRLTGQIDKIYASPLGRTMTTARIIQSYSPNSGRITPVDGLYSICMGAFEGQITDEVNPEINKYLTKWPYAKMPGRAERSTRPGESFNDFVYRLIGFFQMVEDTRPPDQTVLLVTHVFNIVTINAQLDDGILMNLNVDLRKLTTKQNFDPGELLMYNPKKVALDKVTNASTKGLYLVRHGRTDFNN